MFIERNDQKMSHTKRPNESDLVRRSGEQMRRFVRTQYFFRVRIKRDYHRRSIHGSGVSRGSGNDCLMSEMDTVEDANGQKNRALQLRQFGDRSKRFHQANDEIMMNDE